MSNNFKFLLIIGFFLIVIAIFWFVYKYQPLNQYIRSIVVTGEGKEEIVPNIAELRIGVISQGENLSKLVEDNTKKINRILKFLKNQNIEEKDIKTENYSVNPIYDYTKTIPRIVAYKIDQNILVKVRDLKKIGLIFEEAINYGANNVYGPKFVIDDPKVYIEKAREKAINDAKLKAEKIAKLLGFKLGKVINFSELPVNNDIQPMFNFDGRGGEFLQESKELPDIKPGTNQINVQVNITFEIK